MSLYNLDFEDHLTRINSLTVTQTPPFVLGVSWDGNIATEVSLKGFHKAQINMTLSGGAFSIDPGATVTIEFQTDIKRDGLTPQIMIVQPYSNGGFLAAEVLFYGQDGNVTLIFTNRGANLYTANVRFQFLFI